MPLFDDDLRGHVFRASTERICPEFLLSFDRLGQTKVCDLDMPVQIQQYIFWLDISVQNLVFVDVLKSQKDFN